MHSKKITVEGEYKTLEFLASDMVDNTTPSFIVPSDKFAIQIVSTVEGTVAVASSISNDMFSIVGTPTPFASTCILGVNSLPGLYYMITTDKPVDKILIKYLQK